MSGASTDGATDGVKFLESVKGPHKVTGVLYRGRACHIKIGPHTFIVVAPDDDTLDYVWNLTTPATTLNMEHVKSVIVGSADLAEKIEP